MKWQYGDLISGRNIGISMPQKLNPGPLAGRLSLFAPVSLLFFFAVLLIITAVKGIRLHPVHFLMLAAAFFSFHLLFSYMVDHVTPFYAFFISSGVSLLLTVTYLRLVVDWKFSVFQAGVWQFVFLVMFAYAFFFEGYTGLTVTIGAILTLAILMQLTGRMSWEDKLPDRPAAPPDAE
jgi:inner membrane protein involved in colicin E2 resistance